MCVERSGLVESQHDAALAVADPSGRILAIAGDADRAFFARSVIKPFQATVSIRSGARFFPEQLALACASHDGNPVQVALVESMLLQYGFGEADLACPPARPIGAGADRLWAATDRSARRLFHNCSGKHAAMLAACREQGWDPTTYTSAEHPLQRAIRAELVSLNALTDDRIGVDGCGSVTFAVSVATLATAFASLHDAAYREVWTAMHRYPALVSGVGNHDTVLGIGLDAVAKRGAEAALALAVAGRGSMAVKVWDGGTRAVAPIVLAALEHMGWMSRGQASWLGMQLRRPVFGGGRPVGSARPSVDLERVS